MTRFITLTSAQPGVGKLRINIDHIMFYFRKGLSTMVVFSIPGIVEGVAETPEEIENLIKQHSGLKLA